MASNIDLSSEQGKEAHYDRGDLPMIIISAAGPIAGDSREIGGIPINEYRKGLDELHKDLAGLSSNGKHVVVNGTSHTSIVYNDETAEHILSIITEDEKKDLADDAVNLEQETLADVVTFFYDPTAKCEEQNGWWGREHVIYLMTLKLTMIQTILQESETESMMRITSISYTIN